MFKPLSERCSGTSCQVVVKWLNSLSSCGFNQDLSSAFLEYFSVRGNVCPTVKKSDCQFISTNNLLASVPSGSQRNQAALVRKGPSTSPLFPPFIELCLWAKQTTRPLFLLWLTPFCSISLPPQNYRPSCTPLSVIVSGSWWRQCWVSVLAESK